MSPSIRAARADPMRCRPTAGRCGASPPRRGACCSTWRRRASACRSPRSSSARAWSRWPADPPRKVTYGELIGGQRFNVTLTGKNTDTTTGAAKLKTVQELKNVGQSPQRYDIPAKVDGSLEVGRGRQASRHGARAQRQAAGRRRDARQHRRVVGARTSPASSGWSARATTWRWCASARSRRSARRGS